MSGNDACEKVSRQIVDLMREWHYHVDNYEEGKIGVDTFKRRRDETIVELAGALKTAIRECRDQRYEFRGGNK